uniref:Uncharacterized protein n=1 Tax=Manihot esculenta TaxID=3983 RepID=A0A2C9WGL9_MANES
MLASPKTNLQLMFRIRSPTPKLISTASRAAAAFFSELTNNRTSSILIGAKYSIFDGERSCNVHNFLMLRQ